MPDRRNNYDYECIYMVLSGRTSEDKEVQIQEVRATIVVSECSAVVSLQIVMLLNKFY